MSAVLSYRYPPVNPAVSGNMEKWTQTMPQNGATFRSDQNQSIIFNIASNSEFLKTTQSFLSGTLVPRDAGGAEVVTATTSSFQGVSRAFSRLVIRIGNAIVEDLAYNDLLAMYYSTCPWGRKALLKRMEGFSKTDHFATGRKRFQHFIMSSLFVTDQCLPLPLCVGGISIELFLAPASDVFTSANVSYYTVEQPAFKWLSITPDPAFTIGLRSSVASGRSAIIPYQRVHLFPSNGNGSKTQLINVPVGQVKSIASVECLFHSEIDYADRTKDKYGRFINADVIDFKIEGAGIQNPSQIAFGYAKGGDFEAVLMGILTSSGNAYSMHNDMTLEDDFETKSFRLAINYQSDMESFGSGLNTIGAASPFLTITSTHDSVVPATTRISTFVTTDALIEFRGSEIYVNEVF